MEKIILWICFKGDLIAPLNFNFGKIKWGFIHLWPEGLFSVNSLLCIWEEEEAEVQSIYEDFPRWKDKFNDLILIDLGEFIQPEQEQITLLQYRNGVYDGLEIFMIEENKPLKRKVNNRVVGSVYVQMIKSKQCYDVEMLRQFFENVGSHKRLFSLMNY